MSPLDRSRRRPRGALLRAALAACLVAWCGSSCQLVGTRVHNLNELHAEDGHHLRQGNLLSNTGYVMHVGFLGMFSGIGDPQESPPERFDDPVKDCMENLVALGDFDPDDPRHRAVQNDHRAPARATSWRRARSRRWESGRSGPELSCSGPL